MGIDLIFKYYFKSLKMEGAGEKLESIMEDFLNGPNFEIDPNFVNPEDL
ncbi:MAG: hypothetical protein QF864_14035 [SAR202 cluster bacterium]|nr:hypothetical protein [SAR202 cluster bacterium]